MKSENSLATIGESETGFQSLDEMRNAHRSLRRFSKAPENDPAAILKEIKVFLWKGVRLGKQMDLAADRDHAQGMLDYWASLRETEYRSTDDIQRPSSVQDAVLAPFNREAANALVENAEQVLKQLSEDDRDLACRILVRMIHLDPKSRTFTVGKESVTTLRTMGESEKVDSLLKSLETAGVLTQVSGEDGKQMALSHESLMRRWKPLEEALEQRLRFRDAAQFWEANGRDPVALLSSGPLLEAAISYRDMGDLEREFADASRNKHQKAQTKRFQILSGLAIVLSLGSLLLLFLFGRIWVQRNAIAAQMTIVADKTAELQTAKEDLEKAVKDLQEKNQKLLQANELATRQAIESNLELDNVKTLVEKVLDEKLGAPPNSELYRHGMEFKRSYERVLVQPTATDDDKVLRPGTKIGPAEKGVAGSAGVFVQDEKGNNFLVAPNFLLQGGKETGVAAHHGKSPEAKRIGKIAEFSSNSYADPESLGFAKLAQGVQASNAVPGFDEIKEIADAINPGLKVRVFGSPATKIQGEVKRIEKDGTIVTTRISMPGNTGSPVVTMDGKLVGLLTSSNKSETFVTPVKETLEKYKLKLLPSGVTK